MSVKPAGKSTLSVPASFEIKSAQLSTVAVLVKSGSLQTVAQDLLRRFGPEGESPGFFGGDAAVLDFSGLERGVVCENLEDLMLALRQCQLAPVAVRGAPPHWLEPLQALALVDASADIVLPKADVPVQSPVRQAPVQTMAAAAPTLVVDKPLRSGQKVYAKGADLIVLAMVNQGAEVVADGNIHVYAPLRGKAMAGARGNTLARIFSTCLEPELISIAGVYRTSEVPLPKDIAGKAAQVRLSTDGQEKLIIEPLKT